jgi:hypothetical protein
MVPLAARVRIAFYALELESRARVRGASDE